MTHPLTPREKVVFKQPCDHCQRMTTVDLTALASGSGDHAELARLADMSASIIALHGPAPSLDNLPVDPQNWSGFAHAKILAEHRVALLAENTALRSEIETMTTAGIVEVAVRNPSVADYVQHWEGRATEAERKLAEAVSVMDQIREAGSISKARDLARVFISKEAERG